MALYYSYMNYNDIYKMTIVANDYFEFTLNKINEEFISKYKKQLNELVKTYNIKVYYIIDKNNVPHLLTNNVDNLIITNNNNIVSYKDEKMKGNCDIDINTNEVICASNCLEY